MNHFFVQPNQINLPDKCVTILGPDVNHIKNVLRMKPGEELSVSDGRDGREYRCGILSLEEGQILCELRFVKEENVELPSRVYLFQALPKADKMELIVQVHLSNWKSQATTRGGESRTKLPWKSAETPAVNKALINTHVKKNTSRQEKAIKCNPRVTWDQDHYLFPPARME